MPKVSVIVPNYNHAAFLEERLETIFNQSFQDFEVIFLDDGSTDNSRKILKKYENHPKVSHCIFEDENSRLPFRQWQKGIQRATGEYIWIAESDDWAELDFLEKLVSKLNKKTGIAFCKSYTFYDSSKKISSYYFPEDLYPDLWNENIRCKGQDLLERFHSNINTIPNASACVFKKDLVEFCDDLLAMNFCGDWLFWARIMIKTDVFFLAEKLNYWRFSEQSTRERKSHQAEEKRYREGLACIKKICALCGKEKINLKNYDWLFLNYFSRYPMFKIPFLPKPEIAVKNVNFRLYLFRSAFYLLFKKGRSKFGHLKRKYF